jgi:hypothetical protein
MMCLQVSSQCYSLYFSTERKTIVVLQMVEKQSLAWRGGIFCSRLMEETWLAIAIGMRRGSWRVKSFGGDGCLTLLLSHHGMMNI